MCCQESGEREAAVSLFCPKAKPGERKFRKVRKRIVVTLVAVECFKGESHRQSVIDVTI